MGKNSTGPEKTLGDAIASYLSKSGIVRQLGASSIQGIWSETVGEEIAGHTRVTSLRGGVLRIEVDSAPWLHDLRSFHQDELLDALRERLKGRTLKEITFRIGEFGEH